jgi:hypothetical protein
MSNVKAQMPNECPIKAKTINWKFDIGNFFDIWAWTFGIT